MDFNRKTSLSISSVPSSPVESPIQLIKDVIMAHPDSDISVRTITDCLEFVGIDVRSTAGRINCFLEAFEKGMIDFANGQKKKKAIRKILKSKRKLVGKKATKTRKNGKQAKSSKRRRVTTKRKPVKKLSSVIYYEIEKQESDEGEKPYLSYFS